MTLPQARLLETVTRAGKPALAWYCVNCDELLAMYGWTEKGRHLALLRSEYIRLPDDRDGTPTYGLAPRTLVSGRQRRTGRMPERSRLGRTRVAEGYASGALTGPRFEGPAMPMTVGPIRLPAIVYCLRPGVCGKAQRIGVDSGAMID
jgi:hypothetical protein